MILKVLQKSLPMTAGDVYEAVRKRDTKLSLSTVYRNCEALAKKGLLLRSTMLADGLTRYEYTQGDHVHHAVCLSCNKISLSRFVWNRSIKTVWRKKTDLKWWSIVWKFTVLQRMQGAGHG